MIIMLAKYCRLFEQNIAKIARIAKIDFRKTIIAIAGFRAILFRADFGPKTAKIDQKNAIIAIIGFFFGIFRRNRPKSTKIAITAIIGSKL